MTPSEFAAKWSGSKSTERAASQEHFIDLCRMLGYPTPNDDPTDEYYAPDIHDDDLLTRLLRLNLERTGVTDE